MQLVRPWFALDPRRFGRGRIWFPGASSRALTISADLKLFATTFVAGFVFVSILIA